MSRKEPFRTLPEMLNLIKRHKITAYRIEQETSIGANTVERLLTGSTKNPRKSTLIELDDYLMKKFPLGKIVPYKVLDKIDPGAIITYIYENSRRFENEPEFRLFKEVIIEKFKAGFFEKQITILSKALQSSLSKEDIKSLMDA